MNIEPCVTGVMNVNVEWYLLLWRFFLVAVYRATKDTCFHLEQHLKVYIHLYLSDFQNKLWKGSKHNKPKKIKTQDKEIKDMW